MTVSANITHESWLGNGLTTVFPYSMRIINEDDVRVYLLDVNGTEVVTSVNPALYTLTGVGPTSIGGGNLTFLTPVPSAVQIFLYRQPGFLQTTSIVNQGGFLPQVLETALDQLTTQDQFLRYEELRSLKFPLFDDADVVLPTAVNRAGRYMAFDAKGDVTTAAGLIDGNQVDGIQGMVITHAYAGSTIIWDNVAVGAFSLSAQAIASTEVLLIPWNTGMIKLTPAAGATMVCAYSAPGAIHNGSALQYCNIHVRCVRNVTGNAAEWLLSGLTAILA